MELVTIAYWIVNAMLKVMPRKNLYMLHKAVALSCESFC